MTFQAYLDTIKAKTGKTPEDFKVLAKKKGLVKRADIMAWLKTDFGLGHGHANVIAHLLTSEGAPKLSDTEKVDTHFKGAKAAWRKPYDDLMKKVGAFGPDVRTSTTNSYISLLRGEGKFGIVQISAADRIDIGIKLKGAPVSEKYEAAGAWNAMVTHRRRLNGPAAVDAETLRWLKQAYDAAGGKAAAANAAAPKAPAAKPAAQAEPDLPRGLSQPALRAFAAAGLVRLKDFTRVSEAELLEMHGVGPKAITVLGPALAAKGWAFRKAKSGR